MIDQNKKRILQTEEMDRMNTENIERVSYGKMTQGVMEVIRKHGRDNEELEKDLYDLIKLIEDEEKASWKIKELAFALANKL